MKKSTKKPEFSIKELVDFFYISCPGRLWNYKDVVTSLARYLKIKNPDPDSLKRALFEEIMSLTTSEKFFALCYILEESKHVRFGVNSRGVPMILDHDHLCHRLMDDLGFEYKNKKLGFNGESDSVNIVKGSLFVNNKWLHVG